MALSTTERPFKPGRRIDIPLLPNLRDIGGYATASGARVRTGQLYRSTELNHLAGEDLEQFAKLEIRTVFDLRTEAERTAEPDVVPDGTEQVVCDVLKDSQGAAPALLGKILSDPGFADEMLGGGKAVQLFERGYREIVSLPSALVAYRELLRQDHRRHASAGTVSLHDGQGPHRLGRGGDPAAARSLGGGRLL